MSDRAWSLLRGVCLGVGVCLVIYGLGLWPS
jgi:hypothetical protein